MCGKDLLLFHIWKLVLALKLGEAWRVMGGWPVLLSWESSRPDSEQAPNRCSWEEGKEEG